MMKTMKPGLVSHVVLLLALIGSPTAFALEKAKSDPYAEAVASYIEAATAQLRSIRETVDAITEKSPDEVKQKYAGVYQRLDNCDARARALKTATPKEFDPQKAEFERVRGEMVKAFESARR